MSFADIIVIAVIAVILFFAIRSIVKKKGGCSCGCSSGCPKCGSGSSCSCGSTDTPDESK